MIESFNNYIKLNIPDIADKKILLAISGGLDSVALLHLLKNTGAKIFLAHANFQLRGKESDDDALFVKELAEKNDLPLFYEIFKIKKT
jgi:tRNA(Ile)-lysidine synthase